MNAFGAIALALWVALIAASAAVWWISERANKPVLGRTSLLVGIIAAEVLLTGTVAVLAAIGDPLGAPWSWLAVGIAAAAAGVTGGTVALTVLALADSSNRPGTTRVQRTVLRGGAWIGALERFATLGTLLAGWPEGLVAIVAVKAFARYPELSTGQATGAIERFIIGTFTSLGWAAVCAGIATIFLL